MDSVNEIYVYENWKSDAPSLIGTLYVDGGRGKQDWCEELEHLKESLLFKGGI